MLAEASEDSALALVGCTTGKRSCRTTFEAELKMLADRPYWSWRVTAGSAGLQWRWLP